jgi:NAD(P)-dependent dehydrogenase (short-subunit alcohol dehydrogenase family)
MVVASMNDPRMTGPVCLITGAARGLGLAVAVELARRGVTVLAAGRDPAAVAAAVAGHGGDTLRAVTQPLDITDDDQVAAVADAVGAGHGRLDILINNAAAYVDWTETAAGADLGRSRAVMDVNLYGTWRMIQAVLPLLRASAHPRVVNVASGAGSHGDLQYGLTARGGAAASYGVSKAALLALTATLAAEWADTPLMINAVDPDLTATWPGAENMGARPASVSAAGVVWAATLPDDGPRGGFFRDQKPMPW